MPCYNVNDNWYLVTFFIFAMLETLFCSGITYGWASIVVVFKTENFFMNLCEDWYHKHNRSFPLSQHNYTIVQGGAVIVSDDKLPGCPDQDIRFNLIFTVSLFCLCIIKFPAGIFIDRYGPRIARVVGGIMYVVAAFGLGFVTIGYENLLFGVFALICMGGSLLVMAVYQVSNVAYRQYRSRIMCILHGAFDSSAIILLVFKLVYDNGVAFRNMMIVYGIVCSLLIVFGTFVLIPPLRVLFDWVEEERKLRGYFISRKESLSGPDFAIKSIDEYNLINISINYGTMGVGQNYLLPTREKHSGQVDNLNLTDSEELLLKSAEEKDSKDNKPLVEVKESKFVKEGSVLSSILSPLYLFELVYLLTFQLKLWYYVGTLADFFGRLTNNNKQQVSDYVDIFGYIQFGGIFVTPIIGFVFDKDRIGKADEMLIISEDEARIQSLRRCITPFLVTNILCVLFCIVSAIENLQLQILSFILYTVVRGFLYSNHGAYMGAGFPASQFGRLYGLAFFVGGTFGTLQYLLFKITSGPLNGDPFWVNMVLLILVLIGNIHPFYLWWYCRKEEKRLSLR